MTKKKPVELGEQSGIYSVMLQKSGANAFTMMGMGPGIEPPAAGDIIEVEFL